MVFPRNTNSFLKTNHTQSKEFTNFLETIQDPQYLKGTDNMNYYTN